MMHIDGSNIPEKFHVWYISNFCARSLFSMASESKSEAKPGFQSLLHCEWFRRYSQDNSCKNDDGLMLWVGL